MTDWLGTSITIGIILFILLLIWAKVQGDKVIDILSDIRDFMRGDK